MIDYSKEKLKELIEKSGYKISVAESLTSGLIQSQIGSISGASRFFNGGITTYSIDSKVQFLDVDKDHALKVNAVSNKTAEEMAKGVAKKFKTEIGISTTGYAESDETYGIIIPVAYIGIFINDKNQSHIYEFSKKVTGKNLNRNEMREYVTQHTFNFLVEKLSKLLKL